MAQDPGESSEDPRVVTFDPETGYSTSSMTVRYKNAAETVLLAVAGSEDSGTGNWIAEAAIPALATKCETIIVGSYGGSDASFTTTLRATSASTTLLDLDDETLSVQWSMVVTRNAATVRSAAWTRVQSGSVFDTDVTYTAATAADIKRVVLVYYVGSTRYVVDDASEANLRISSTDTSASLSGDIPDSASRAELEIYNDGDQPSSEWVDRE